MKPTTLAFMQGKEVMEEVWIEMALEDDDWTNRMDAVEFIRDSAVLQFIVDNDTHETVRVAAQDQLERMVGY
jgi:hypothetical protein